MTLLAFHNDPSLKEFVVGQLAIHRETDKIVYGQYWRDGKGCAVGCTLEAVRLRKGKGARIDHGHHALYESELGIPHMLARLEDRIFENLPNDQAQLWPERFTKAIRPGADLTLVWPRFALWLLSEELPQYTKKFPKCTAALSDVAAFYREWTETGKNPDADRWRKGRSNAWDARMETRRAAYAAVAVFAAYAAVGGVAAAAAAYAADAAAYAADAADADAARSKSIIKQSDKLIELLEAA